DVDIEVGCRRGAKRRADRANRGAEVAAEFHLVVNDRFKALLRHNDEDQLIDLGAEPKADATLTHGVEGGGGPVSCLILGKENAAAARAANEKASLEDLRKDDDTLGDAKKGTELIHFRSCSDVRDGELGFLNQLVLRFTGKGDRAGAEHESTDTHACERQKLATVCRYCRIHLVIPF